MRNFSYDQGSIVFMNFSTEKVFNPLQQGFANWGTCTPRGTFAYLKGYFWS